MTLFSNTISSTRLIIVKNELGGKRMYTNMTTNLMVESVDKSVSFYENILGFSVAVSVPGKNGELQFAILAKEKLMLMVQERTNLMEEYPILTTEAVHPSVSLYITVDNFAALHDELKAIYPINTELHTSFYGAKEFAITDPDGYVLTFTEHKDS